MRKISKEEYEKMKLCGKGSSSPFFAAMYGLKPNEGLEIKKSEWLVKYKPGRLAKRLREKHGYDIDVAPLADRSGWVAYRKG